MLGSSSAVSAAASMDSASEADSSLALVAGAVGGVFLLIAVLVAAIVYYRKEKPKDFSIQEIALVMPVIEEDDLVVPEEIKRRRVHPDEEIGEGAFGTVWRAII